MSVVKPYDQMTTAERELAMYHPDREEIAWMAANGFKINPTPITESEMRSWWIWGIKYFVENEDHGMIEVFTSWMPAHFFKFIVSNHKHIYVFGTGSGDLNEFLDKLYPLFETIAKEPKTKMAYIRKYLKEKRFLESNGTGISVTKMKVKPIP